MKILLTNFHPYNGGGHTTYLLYLFRELNKHHKVFLACPKTSRLNNFAKGIKEENVIDIDFPGKIKEIKDIAKNLKILTPYITNEKFDLIHVNGSPDHRMVIYAKILLNNSAQIIRTKHDSLKPKTNPLAKIQRNIFTNHTILVSENQKQMMLDSGCDPDKLTVIHNGIDTDYFSVRPKSEDLLKKYGIHKDDLVFVSTAGTDLYKGWHLLVEAASRLDNGLKDNIKIILAGNMPKNEIIKTYIDRFDMSKQVFFTGLLPDVREVVSIADIGFVLSYKIETISFACREMMSMGKPVLVSDFAGLPENINDNINGWVTKTGDVYGILAKIKEIIRNKESLNTASLAARRKAEKEFGLSSFINKTLSCYNLLRCKSAQ
ncbi:MAG: glycosyltransferase family 4 protein [Nitrospirae bacterium]|nr:glycosyltransferase family 4 protein [Nitrospirota bacterium]